MAALPALGITRLELLGAWRAWDEASSETANTRAHLYHPAAGRLEVPARKLELAFGNHAANLGLRVTPFRDICDAWRRAGYTRDQALEALEVGLKAIR